MRAVRSRSTGGETRSRSCTPAATTCTWPFSPGSPGPCRPSGARGLTSMEGAFDICIGTLQISGCSRSPYSRFSLWEQMTADDPTHRHMFKFIEASGFMPKTPCSYKRSRLVVRGRSYCHASARSSLSSARIMASPLSSPRHHAGSAGSGPASLVFFQATNARGPLR